MSGINNVVINERALKRMRNLRFLHVYKTRYVENDRVEIPEELEFPPQLRLLHWEAYPRNALPRTFHPEYLVELNLQESNLEKLWQGTQVEYFYTLNISLYILLFLYVLIIFFILSHLQISRKWF